jgi:hypothetical protein
VNAENEKRGGNSMAALDHDGIYTLNGGQRKRSFRGWRTNGWGVPRWLSGALITWPPSSNGTYMKLVIVFRAFMYFTSPRHE